MSAHTLWTAAFWKAAGERAVKTFAQTLAALLVADGTDLLTTDWAARASVAGMAALVSVLTSVASDAATGDGPSLTKAEGLYQPRHAERGYMGGVSGRP